MNSAPVPLRAAHVGKRWGDLVALDGVSLDVRAGECVALVGESGAGKTTLLRSFNRLLQPDGGELYLGDDDVSRIDPVELRRQVGYVPQEGGLLPHWSVVRNVELVPWLRRMPDARALARDALAAVGLDPDAFADRWPHELSGGQRQRVALARAFAARPSVVLLDEPFGALDAITRADAQRTFAEIRRSRPVTALLVTHDLREAFTLADRVAIMRAGRIEQIGTPAELVAHPRDGYAEQLLERAGVRA